MKMLFLLLSLSFLWGCASAPERSAALESEKNSSVTVNRSPDLHCSQYSGSICVAAVINQPPDSTCSMYQGSVCVMPVFNQMPDSTCSMYQGSVCVSPIVPGP